MFSTMLAFAAVLAQTADPAAVALLDRALERIGGASALESIERIRYDFVTQWQRTSYDARPYTDRPSYEAHTDVRDYTIGGWRNTREFVIPGGGSRSVVDLVRDSVAVRDLGRGWMPLNITYVDERDELFTYSPDRLLLLARAAEDLTLDPDTTIGGVPHERVSATLNDIPATLFLRKADGMIAMLRMRHAHPNDFGLVPLGNMDIEVWYSSWTPQPEGITLPRQWDIMRAGAPYKRMTARFVAINPTFAPDSFAVSDELRSAYAATSRRPMHDLPLDSARITDGSFIVFGAFGAPAGAVKVGNAWLLLGAGQAPLSTERALAWMKTKVDATPASAIVGLTTLGNGGVAHLAKTGLPTVIAPGFEPLAKRIFYGYEVGDAARMKTVRAATWLPVGTDSVLVEPIDLPDARGTLLVWVPSLKWVYAPMAMTPLDRTIVMERAREAGWNVERIGNAREIAMPAG